MLDFTLSQSTYWYTIFLYYFRKLVDYTFKYYFRMSQFNVRLYPYRILLSSIQHISTQLSYSILVQIYGIIENFISYFKSFDKVQNHYKVKGAITQHQSCDNIPGEGGS